VVAEKPKFKIPDDFEDEAAFLADMRESFADDVAADKDNAEAAAEDQAFMVGDQWDPLVKQRRLNAKKPVLTINRLPAFVAQIVGNRRLNETTIKVVPDGTEDKAIARIREGLIRSIQKISRADIAYDKALESQVICGIGNFQVELVPNEDDVWVQDIRISPIVDALSVVWDRMLTDPTGADAEHCFVVDTYKESKFKKRWPWATPADVVPDAAVRQQLLSTGWYGANDVRVVSYWRMRTKKRTLALMVNGKTRDITDDDTPETLAQIAQREDGSPIMRDVDMKYAQMYLCSGTDILAGPYDLPIKRVPVFRVPGWEITVGTAKHRWGLIRFLKDPQRLHNYWRSVIAEKLMMSPRAGWKASAEAVAGREQQWRDSHVSDDPLLIYNGEAGSPPERVEPATMEPALLAQAEITTQDIKDVSNIHEANLGMTSNEVSGAAILARQRVSDTGTVLYHDNLNLAIEQWGMVANDLIDVAYDTPRVIKVLGEDGREDLIAINGFGENSIDITDGKYNVSVTTGPSYVTKRMEAQASMMAFINAAPQVAGYTLDLIADNMDWPGSDEFVRRARMMLPPGMVNPKDMTPEEQQAYQSAQQQNAKTQALAIAKELAELQKTQAQTAESAARAQNYQAQADSTPFNTQTKAVAAASQSADRELRGHLEAIKVAENGA